MNLTQLTPTDLYVLPVEQDAFSISCLENHLNYAIPRHHYFLGKDLPQGDWKLIGTITKEGVVDFDSKKYAQEYSSRHKAEIEFISLLESNGVFLKNPMGENEPEYIAGIKNGIAFHNNEVVNQWQSYQDKVVPDGMKLIVIEKTPFKSLT